MVVNVDPVLQGYSSERARDYYERLLDGLRALPGVDGATRANHLPLDGSAATRRVAAEGRTASADEQLSALFYAVEPGFFATLGMPILEGREFIAGDDSTAGLVTVVNQALARRLWPDEQAVGKRMAVGERVATVIGLAADAKFMFLRESPEPMFALSLRQSDTRAGALLVRTSVDPRAAVPAIRGVASDIDPRIALSGLKTLRENARYSLTAAESGAAGATTFGLLALLLSAAGLYGVVSHAVARRVREIGIRMALGARGRSVVSMIVGRGLRLGLAGVAIGAVLALATGRLLSGMLYGVAPADALTFLAVAGVLVLVSVLASWAPSRRAASVDPLSVLRSD
jgi:predicted permease